MRKLIASVCKHAVGPPADDVCRSGCITFYVSLSQLKFYQNTSDFTRVVAEFLKIIIIFLLLKPQQAHVTILSFYFVHIRASMDRKIINL